MTTEEQIETPPTSNVRFKSFGSLESAASQAQAEAANTSGYTLPVTVFRQGRRFQLATAIPVSMCIQFLRSDPVDKKAGLEAVRSFTNRPVDTSHVRETRRYLADNFHDKYILPPLTINIRETVNVYCTDFAGPVKPGYLVIPFSARLSITDGQHRRLAMEEVLQDMSAEDAEAFQQDGVAIMVTCETETEQVHQDFADCSKTKPLPKSLIAVYDKRNPANALVMKLIDSCPLFRGKIDSTSNTLSKRSNAVFLTNQVRTLAKELLIGNGAMSDVEFDKRANDMLADHTVFERQLGNFTAFVNTLTEEHPVLKQVSELPQGPERQKIPQLREEWLILTGNAWAIMGRIGHELFRDSVPNWVEYAKRLAKSVDWRRDADIWKGNLVQDGVVVRTNKAWNAATAKVREAVGLKTPEPMPELIATAPSGVPAVAEAVA